MLQSIKVGGRGVLVKLPEYFTSTITLSNYMDECLGFCNMSMLQGEQYAQKNS